MFDVEDLLVFGTHISLLTDLVITGYLFLMVQRTFALRFPELTIIYILQIMFMSLYAELCLIITSVHILLSDLILLPGHNSL